MGFLRRITLAGLLILCGASSWGQDAPKDSVFRLVQAERAEQYERYGLNYRLVKGHARFFHNDTYLLCDSASWNVDAKFIEAYGNVQLIQENTMLKSEDMLYWIEESRAQFRGPVVELLDKDGNTLRTSKLTYYTKDSIAVFEYGGSLKDKNGNVIESSRGTYDGKEGLFTFEERVELYMDTIEIKTQTLRYFSEEEKAYFGRNTFAWRGDGFLRADGGWYDRKQQVVRFADHVFLFDPTYDAWADEVYYYQADGAVDLLQNAQVLDSTNKSIYLGDHMQYFPATDSLSERGLLTGNPAIIYFGENENHVVDTLYSRADTFFVYSVPRCDIPAEEVKEAQKRVEDIHFDALGKKRKEEAEAREQERIRKMREAGKLPPEWLEKQKKAEADSLAARARRDSLAAVSDSLVAAPDTLTATSDSLVTVPDTLTAAPDSLAAAVDSLAAAPDSLVSERDTTPIRYVLAWNNVKMYRSDLQAVCDSVVFTELDSVVRLYGSPALWNEVRNQLTADEMHLLIRGGTIDRGSLVTNAWLISQQDSTHYNQIKSTEMSGWFRDNKLYRFDALGGVSAIFYMADEDVITTINVKESKSMTASIKDGTAQRLFYVEAIKSDVYPVGELAPEKQRLKDFKWRGDERPVSSSAITSRKIRPSERGQYEGMRRPLYRETNKFFDNYMFDLFEKIDAQKKAELARRQAEQDSLARLAALELAEPEREVVRDTVAPSDTVPTVEIVSPDDSLATVVPDRAGNPAVDTATVQRAVLPVIDRVRPSAKPERGEVAPASPETVSGTRKLTWTERRALRRAERIARREACRAARAARRTARKAEREAARIARQAAKVEKERNR